MPKFRHIHSSFRGGEISPSSQGLTNTESYQQSLDTLTNYIVKPEGGVERRPGSQLVVDEQTFFVINTGLGAGSSVLSGSYRIFPFVASQNESYAVIIKADGTNSLISIINTSTLTQCAYNKGSSFVSSFETLYVNSLWPSTIDLNEIQYAQNNDILILTHPSAAPFVLKRVGTNSFARGLFYINENRVGEGYNQFGFPYLDLNTNPSHTMVITGAGGTTLTSSVSFFTSDHVGSVIKLVGDNGSGTTVTNAFFITGFTSATVVTGSSGNVDVASGPFPVVSAVTTPTSVWQESAFSFERGWPRSVCFHEQRAYYGGTEFEPDKVYASQIGDIFELDSIGVATAAGYLTIDEADPFSFVAASNEANIINYLSSGRTLIIGSLGREHIATGTSGALSALDISVQPQTSYGSLYCQPVRLDNALLFVSRNNSKLREFIFNESEQSFKADDLSRLARHFNLKALSLRASYEAPKISCLAMQKAESDVVWALDVNGILYAITRDPFTNTRGWHLHKFGGVINTDETPFIHSIASIPNGSGTNDDLWIAVERTIDGNNVTYIEKIGQQYRLDGPQNSSSSIDDKMVYCDSAKLKYNATAFTTVDGLDHLEGEEVVCVADGDYKGTFTVSGGEITLTDAVNDAIVGLNYTSELKTLPHDVGSALQTSQVAIKRFDRVGIRFVRSIGCQFGSVELDALDDIDFYDPNIAANLPVPLFTGDKIEDIADTYDRRGQIIIRQSLPLPQEIASIVLRGILYD